MATATCTDCGKPTSGAARCPDCQNPARGQPRKAPAGSGARPGGRDISRRWDVVVLASIVLALVLTVVAWIV